MNLHRISALLLVGIQAATIAYLSQLPAIPVALFCLAFIGWMVPKKWAISQRREMHLCLFIIVLFIAKHVVLPQSFRPMALSYATPLSYTVAHFLLAIQAIQFFLKRSDDSLPSFLPGMAALTMACAANIVVLRNERFVTQIFVAAAVAIAAIYATTGRRRCVSAGKQRRFVRAFAFFVLAGTAAGAGWVSASGLLHNARGLEDWLGWAGRVSRGSGVVGFSGKAKLDGIQIQKQTGPDEIALTVYCDTKPGYLRGKIFDYYEGSEWHIGAGSRVLPAADPAPEVMTSATKHEPVFLLLDDKSYERAQPHLDEGARMECWPDIALGGNIFSPLGSAYFQGDTRSATANGHGVVDSSDLPGGFPFALYVLREQPHVGLWNNDRQLLLTLPKTLDPRVHALADKLFADCRTTDDKIAAVENYFVSNYQYQLGISIPPKLDPLNYFLLDRPAAHCEFFASGAALLLRLGGVPTRYATGFVTVEHNDIGESWVAHNRDAHAWVEAFDEERGWVIVEATPSSGQPQEQQASVISQFWDNLRSRMTIIRFRFDQGGVEWVLAAAWQLLVDYSWIVLSITVAFVAILIAIWGSSAWRMMRTDNPRIAAMHKLLATIDRRLSKKWKLHRHPGETLHQFAARIREISTEERMPRDESKAATIVARRRAIAQWYERYAAVRYSTRLDERTVAALKAAI